jgi:hypothetical protein
MNLEEKKLAMKKLTNNQQNCYVNIIINQGKTLVTCEIIWGTGTLVKMTLPIVAYEKHYNKMCPCT